MGHSSPALILIVDDSPLNTQVLGNIFSKSGYRLATAKNGLEALDYVNRKLPDLILLDIMMPEMDGFELCIKLKRNKVTSNIPVLFVTALRDTSDKVKAFEAGAIDYIIKPFTEQEVLARVNVNIGRKRAEEVLRQSEKMASLGRLVGGIAHEINNPINFIISGINSLKDRFDNIVLLLDKYNELEGNCPIDLSQFLYEIASLKGKISYHETMEDVQTLLSTITEGSDRTTSIIRDLKEYSRSRNKEIIQIDINEYIESTLNLLYNQFKGRIEIKKEYCSDSKIECHPGQVNQVLMNILVNAIQAIEDRGTIKIRTEKEKNNLDISILDTGKGIPQEVISTVFEPFFTTRGVGGGTGLGLSISYEIIQNHHGDIDIESEPGKGTIVQIKLPVKQYGDG